MKTIKNNETVIKNCQRRWDSISKPLDGFGDFETVITKIHGILGCERIDSFQKALVIVCGDNGIVEEGVSQCGSENTLLVARLLGEKKSSAQTLAAYNNTEVFVYDMGIDSPEIIPGVDQSLKIRRGTENFLKAAAMTEEECQRAILAGIEIVGRCRARGYSLVATGEMGIGNTTTATAVLCGLTGMDVDEVTGRGAGLSDRGLANKKRVIREGLLFHGLNSGYYEKCKYIYKAISAVGGLDIATLTGVFLGGGRYGIPIVIDGLVTAVAAYCAYRMQPGLENIMIPSHRGRERGVEKVLSLMGLKPLIDGDMALGEGTGALMAMTLLDQMLDYYNRAASFDDGNIKNYSRDLH